jgi:spore coat protein U-like protein
MTPTARALPMACVLATACCASGSVRAAPACSFEQPETTVSTASSTDERFVRATSATYHCTGLTPDVYYYFCAGPQGGGAASDLAGTDGAPAARPLNLFGQPLSAGDLLRAFRADGPTREETVPLFRLGIRPAPGAAAGVERSRGMQTVDVVQGGAVFSSREGCPASRPVAQARVDVALTMVRTASCDVTLSPTLAFGRAPPSWDALPDPASRLRLRCVASVSWRASLDDGANASGDGALRRHLAPQRRAYGVHVGAAGTVDVTGATGHAGAASLLMRGHLPDDPRAEGMDGQTDTLVVTLDF